MTSRLKGLTKRTSKLQIAALHDLPIKSYRVQPLPRSSGQQNQEGRYNIPIGKHREFTNLDTKNRPLLKVAEANLKIIGRGILCYLALKVLLKINSEHLTVQKLQDS